MVPCVWYITPLLLASVVLADYYIDNANVSVVYAMPASQSGTSWQTFSVSTQSLELQFSNSTGNYTITLDSSNCYDQNYALGVCGTGANCFVQVPFAGSGITMYVFNAGASGMAASFSVDGGAAVSKSIAGPTVAENYQVSNVSLYDVQGLPTGNHTIQMTLLDWNGGATSMKFDYAYVNETFVATPTPTTTSSIPTTTSTSQASTQTLTQTSAGNSSTPNKVNVGGVVGGTLGGLAVLAGIVIGFLYFRKRRAASQEDFAPEATFQVDPFTSEYLSSRTLPSQPYTQHSSFLVQYSEGDSTVPPLTRSAILRDALAPGRYASEPIQSSQSTGSGMSPSVLQPLRRHPSYSAESDPQVLSSVSHLPDAGLSPSPDPAIASQYNLTAEQLEVIHRLQADGVPAETVARVIEGFVSSQLSAGETKGGTATLAGSALGSVPPPSYRTRDR